MVVRLARDAFAEHRPRDRTDAERCAHLVGGLASALDHGGEVVEVRVIKAPAVNISHSLHLSDGTRLASLQRDSLCQPEHLLARDQRELVDQLEGLFLAGVVPDFGLDEHGVAGSIVPDVDTERLDADGIRLNE